LSGGGPARPGGEPGQRHLRGLAVAGAGILILSPDGLIVRLLADTDALQLAFWRGMFLGLSLFALLAIRQRGRLRRIADVPARPWLLSSALLTGTLVGFSAAITHTSVANTLILLATMPLFAAAIGRVALGERVAPRTLAAIGLGLVGVGIVFAGSAHGPGEAEAGLADAALAGGSLKGDLYALATAVCHGANLVVLRRAGDRIILPALGTSGLAGALLLAPFADPLAVPMRDLGLLALSGGIQLPLALTLFFLGTRDTPAAEVALMSLLETVLGPLWAWLGVGEVPGTASLVGGTFVVGAILVNALLGLRRRPTRPVPAPAGAAGADVSPPGRRPRAPGPR